MLAFLLVSVYYAQSQTITVTGTVKSELSGETIRQLSIVEKNSGIGTITTENGGYFLALKSGKVELNYSDENHLSLSIGFILRNDTTIHVILKPSDTDSGKKAGKDAEFLSGRNKLVALKAKEK